jgi:hypothetical protein
LNSSLKGASKTSQHLVGAACDFTVGNIDVLDGVFNSLVNGLIVLPYSCSQVIRESNGTNDWIHMGLKTEEWLDRQKLIIASPTSSVTEEIKAQKRLVATEYLTTEDTKSYKLIKYVPYGG